MKKTCIIAAILIGVVFLPAGGRRGAAQTPRNSLRLPPVATVTLKNGIRLFCIRDEIPQVTIMVSTGFGKLYETKETAGIAELIANTISLGGSKKYPGGVLHEKIDAMGGRLSVTSSFENTVISIKVLDRFADEAFAIAADLAANPGLEQKDIDTAKALIVDSIRRKQDDPAEIAFERAREIIFDGNGYGARPTEEKMASYSREFVRETWRANFAGRNMMVGISSSLDCAAAERLCRRHFSAIAPGAAATYRADREAIIRKVKDSAGKIFFYPKDIPQSTVIVGTVAPDIRQPGNYALELMNYILGGGSFTSRLMTEIRVKRGLAYAVQSILRARSRTGLFLAFALTENSTAGQVLALLNRNIDRISHEKISDSEIEWARRAISNSFVFRFDTPMNVLGNYMDIAYNNLPADYYDTYLSRIGGVGASDILAEAHNLFDAGLVTVVVGNESVVKDLKKFGEVVILK
ncbi:MAG: insulinase family protein [Spirochaetes bacterium]|nr:insulinase family protein [Spirochaetota bacterium]